MRVLIGACGGLTGLYLIKRFKKDFYRELDVYGFDSSSYNPSKFFLDKFFLSPKLMEEEKFLDFLTKVMREQSIDFYIPTYSKEIEAISRNQLFIRENSKAQFIVSDISTIEALEDKRNAYRNLRRIGIKVPIIYEQAEQAEFPLFAKPRAGSGSKGAAIIHSPSQMKAAMEAEQGLIFMELLQGKEYTVDAVFNCGGKLIAYNQRIREKSMGGAAIISRNNFDIDCREMIVKIAEAYPIKGVCNFQFFLTEKGVVFTDINLRFASGGLPLSVASGVNIPEILIKLMLGEPVEGKYASDRKERIMYRYFEEIYEEEGSFDANYRF